MRTLLLVVLALLLAAALGQALAGQQGIVIFHFGEQVVEMHLLFFVFLATVLFIVLYIVCRVLGQLFRLPATWQHIRKHRRALAAESALNCGLASMMQREWRTAESHFLRAAAGGSAPHLAYLLAARAASEQGDPLRCDAHIHAARRYEAGGGFLTNLAQAELQLNRGEAKQALLTLSCLPRQRSGQRQVDEMLLTAYARLKDWQAVLDLLDSRRLWPRETTWAKRQEAWIGRLQLAETTADLCRLWRDMPRRLRHSIPVLAAYVTRYLELDPDTDTARHCESLLRGVLKRSWDAGLVRLYGLLDSGDSAAQLRWLSGLLRAHPDDPVLLLSLGRLAAQNRLWDKARIWLENSLAAQATAEVCYELAKLHRREGDMQAACLRLQQGLALVVGAGTQGMRLAGFLEQLPPKQESDREGLARQVV